MNNKNWPVLPLEEWYETYDLLHLITQIIGKIKLQFVPFQNHWWNVVLYPYINGFTSGIIPYKDRYFQVDMDFRSHMIYFKFSNGRNESIELRSGSIRFYYEQVLEKLKTFECTINIWPVPVEMEYRVPFYRDDKFRIYDPVQAENFLQVILNIKKVMDTFRAGFTGKASPVHFFWGSFDMALTFFSGRTAPKHTGAPNVAVEVMEKAYNAELVSFGFWPGKGLGEPALYSYTYPAPDDYKNFKVEPAEAFYHTGMGEFILPYKEIQNLKAPEKAVYDFFRSCYKAAETSGGWDPGLANY